MRKGVEKEEKGWLRDGKEEERGEERKGMVVGDEG